jgi:CheY-like chemotaxis protein
MSTMTRPQKTVLVVEDDPWIRSLMADLLKGEGYDVVQASDGKAGLEMAPCPRSQASTFCTS